MFKLPPPEPDGLHLPVVGSWSRAKHYFLQRYIDAFTTSMKNKGWTGLHYIDLFAGAGIENVKNYGPDWGSPLIAAQAPNRFTRLHFSELTTKAFKSLQTRIARFDQPNPPQLICGDANKVVHQIVSTIPTGVLALVFLDPFGLHLVFQTVRVLSSIQSDLIVFFPDHLDALRNWENVYAGKPDSNLDRVLGDAPWRERMTSQPKDKWAQELAKIYVEQFKTLGYRYFDYERISLPKGAPLYRLIFCTKDKHGAKLWAGIAQNRPDGQRSFDFT